MNGAEPLAGAGGNLSVDDADRASVAPRRLRVPVWVQVLVVVAIGGFALHADNQSKSLSNEAYGTETWPIRTNLGTMEPELTLLPTECDAVQRPQDEDWVAWYYGLVGGTISEPACLDAIRSQQTEYRELRNREAFWNDMESSSSKLFLLGSLLIGFNWLRRNFSARFVVPNLARARAATDRISTDLKARNLGARHIAAHGENLYKRFLASAHCSNCKEPLRIVVLDSEVSKTAPMCERCGHEQPALQFPPSDI